MKGMRNEDNCGSEWKSKIEEQDKEDEKQRLAHIKALIQAQNPN